VRKGLTEDLFARAELSASVEKLLTLEIKTVYPTHGKPFQTEQLMENDY